MKVDVERVLQRLGIEARKKGKEWVALCPNRDHQDRSPSWRIRDEASSARHAFHHCWPCGFKGGVLSLIAHVKGFRDDEGNEDYSAAKAWLGEEGEVEADPVGEVVVEVKPPRLHYQLPSEVCIESFESWPSPAREYFLKRGLEPWQVERWGLGYAVSGRLRGRIIIVYRDAKGRPVRYTARSFTGAEKRYLEPEMHEGANMNAMFGEQHWPALEDRELLFLMEGGINGLALEAEMEGVYFAATAGSEMRGLYATKLDTWKRVCTMSDPDKAGDKLAEEIDLSLARHGKRIERLRLPAGFDSAKLREERPGELGRIVRAWLRGV